VPIRRQGGVRQLFRPRGLLAAGLHREVWAQVARVGGEAEDACHGYEQEHTEKDENEHGKNYALAKILPRVAEMPVAIEILPIPGHAVRYGP
jgi:hypothetical protein